jgi:hypothetical protein
MSYYGTISGILAALGPGAASGPPNATVPYSDDFSSLTFSPANGFFGEAAEQVVDGVASIDTGAGELVYTAGAGDGAQPRIVRAINVTPGEWYRAEAPRCG